MFVGCAEISISVIVKYRQDFCKTVNIVLKALKQLVWKLLVR